MTGRRVMRVAFWSLAARVLLAAAGFLRLRQSPYWPGITPFSESHWVKSFRDMGRVFPARAVERGEAVWAFDHAPQPLPETYRFSGQHRSLVTFLDRTLTTSLLVVHRGAITHEEYGLAEYLVNRIWGPRRVRAGAPTERDVTSLCTASMRPWATSLAWGGCIWKAARGTGGRSSLPTGCMPRSTRWPRVCYSARSRPAAGPSAMASSGGSPKTRRANLLRSGSEISTPMSIRSARWSSSRPAPITTLMSATTRPSRCSGSSRRQLQVGICMRRPDRNTLANAGSMCSLRQGPRP